jgi:hypothetical protein
MLHLLKKVPWQDIDKQFIRNIYVSSRRYVFIQTNDIMIVYDTSSPTHAVDMPFEFNSGMMIYKVDKPSTDISDNLQLLKPRMKLLTI